MNFGNTELELQCEKAVQFLCECMPIGEERRKPLLMHSLRVGMYLYEHNYSNDIVLGGLLHDVLEWTKSSENQIREMFGDQVLAIVKANTKDRNISDPRERRQEYIDRYIQAGEDALIVKAADTMDSYRFYQSTNNTDEVARSVDIAKAILEKLPSAFQDSIFHELRNIQ